MNQDQTNYSYDDVYFPNNYYYPPFYYPMQQPQPSQQNFQNYNQPLFFEIPDQNLDTQQHDFSKNVPPFIQYFQDDNGEVDIDKVISTANQFMKTASQIGPMVKSLNDFVKGLKL